MWLLMTSYSKMTTAEKGRFLQRWRAHELSTKELRSAGYDGHEEFIADVLESLGLRDLSGPDLDLLLSLLNALEPSAPWWNDPAGVRRIWSERTKRAFDGECHLASLLEPARAEGKVDAGEGAVIAIGASRPARGALGGPTDRQMVILYKRLDGTSGFAAGRAFREIARSIAGLLLAFRAVSWQSLTRGLSAGGLPSVPFDCPVDLTCHDGKTDALDTDCFEEGVGYAPGNLIADSSKLEGAAEAIGSLSLLKDDGVRRVVRQAARFYLDGCVASNRGASIVALATSLETLFATYQRKGIFDGVAALFGRTSPEAELARDLHTARSEFVHRGSYNLPEWARLRDIVRVGEIIREFIERKIGPVSRGDR